MFQKLRAFQIARLMMISLPLLSRAKLPSTASGTTTASLRVLVSEHWFESLLPNNQCFCATPLSAVAAAADFDAYLDFDAFVAKE